MGRASAIRKPSALRVTDCQQQHNALQPVQMTDYTPELQRIVEALNRPTTPAWLIATFSAVLGVIGGIVGQSLLMPINDFWRLYRLRRLLYTDLAKLFLLLDSTMQQTHLAQPYLSHWQRDQVRTHMSFAAEKYLQSNHDLYIQLPEHSAADVCYANFRKVLDEPFVSHCTAGLALTMFAGAIERGDLEEERFRWFLREPVAAKLLRRVDQLNEQQRAVTNAG